MPTRPSRKRLRSVSKPAASAESVFLNIPYDPAFENLLLAYISAISAFGFTPRATLYIDGTDAYIHNGTIRGVFRELCKAFVFPTRGRGRRATRSLAFNQESTSANRP
jgi:hypothetical protein